MSSGWHPVILMIIDVDMNAFALAEKKQCVLLNNMTCFQGIQKVVDAFTRKQHENICVPFVHNNRLPLTLTGRSISCGAMWPCPQRNVRRS